MKMTKTQELEARLGGKWKYDPSLGQWRSLGPIKMTVLVSGKSRKGTTYYCLCREDRPVGKQHTRFRFRNS